METGLTNDRISNLSVGVLLPASHPKKFKIDGHGYRVHYSSMQKFTSWSLTPTQTSLLRKQAKFATLSQNKFIRQRVLELGETGIASFKRHSLGEGQGRKPVKLRLDTDLIELMDAMTTKGLVPSKQAILDACIGPLSS